MATVEHAAVCDQTSASRRDKPSAEGRPLHRIRTVRLQEGVSLRSAARHMDTGIRQVRMQEQESTNLQLVDLHKWQVALDVPIAELLVEPDASLSRPVFKITVTKFLKRDFACCRFDCAAATARLGRNCWRLSS